MDGYAMTSDNESNKNYIQMRTSENLNNSLD